MVCIYCKQKTAVTNSRSSAKRHSTWRRRECLNCHSIFTTRENVDYGGAIRVRSVSSTLQPFQRDKLLISIYSSLSHRKTSIEDAGALAESITQHLIAKASRGLIEATEIKVFTLVTLRRFDKAAATHYFAHHPS